MKVLVGLSGGIDSTVATKLLIDQNFEVTACTLRLLPECTGKEEKDEQTIIKAKEIAKKLNIPHIVYDIRKEFKEKVIDYFVLSYKLGHTPNPCYMCNSNIKFGLMLENALKDGFEKIATGHYASIIKECVNGKEKFNLFKGKDKQKDQSYFLSCLSQTQLKHSIFPLSNLTKEEVKNIAFKESLVNEEIKESQDICFVKNGEYATLISTLSLPNSFPIGFFIDKNGNKLKKHKGLQHYTIGQRRGLDVPMGYPIYVIKKDAKTNTVTVGEKLDLVCHSLIASNINIIGDVPKNEKIKIKARTRYRQVEKDAYLTIQNDIALVEFFQFDEAVAKGQIVAFYVGERCLGSGIIQQTF